MAGILLLAWSIVESLDHNTPFGPLQRASDPMTESPIARDESAMSEEQKRSSNALYIGPPQLSLELQRDGDFRRSGPSALGPRHRSAGATPKWPRHSRSPLSSYRPRTTLRQPTRKGWAVRVPHNPSSHPYLFLLKSSQPNRSLLPQSTTPNIMQEMTITPPPAAHAFSPTMPTQRPAGAMRTAVQLTFSLEIGSMQLTPTFEMRDLQLKPTSRIVTMRLAPCQAPHPPIDLQITFEIAKIELEGETIRSSSARALDAEKPAVISSSSFAVARLELEPNSGIASVQLTPSHQARRFGASHRGLPNFGHRIFAWFRNSRHRAQLHLAQRLTPAAWRRTDRLRTRRSSRLSELR